MYLCILVWLQYFARFFTLEYFDVVLPVLSSTLKQFETKTLFHTCGNKAISRKLLFSFAKEKFLVFFLIFKLACTLEENLKIQLATTRSSKKVNLCIFEVLWKKIWFYLMVFTRKWEINLISLELFFSFWKFTSF